MLLGDVGIVVVIGCILQGYIVIALLAVDGEGIGFSIVDYLIDAVGIARYPLSANEGVEGLHGIVLEQAQIVEARGRRMFLN